MMTREVLDKNINIVTEIKNKIDSLWKQCDNKEIDCDDASYEVEELENDTVNYLSMYLIVKELDKEHNRNEDEQYDVRKIKISKEAEDIYKEYDRKVLSIVHSDWTELKINKEVGMLYLMSGFVVDETLKDYEIKLEDGFKRKRT